MYLFNIIGDNNLAKNILQNYLEKCYIKRIKHNLYGVVSLEINERIADKFLIASNITESSFVSHHSRFEFYDYYTQVYNGVNVSFFFEFEEINLFNSASFIFHLYQRQNTYKIGQSS